MSEILQGELTSSELVQLPIFFRGSVFARCASHGPPEPKIGGISQSDEGKFDSLITSMRCLGRDLRLIA